MFVLWRGRVTDSGVADGRETERVMQVWADLLQWITEFSEDTVFIKHLALEALLIILMNSLSHVCRKLMEWHVLLYLLILKTKVVENITSDKHTDRYNYFHNKSVTGGWVYLNFKVKRNRYLLLILSSGRIQRLYKGSGVAQKHGIARGAHNHT